MNVLTICWIQIYRQMDILSKLKQYKKHNINIIVPEVDITAVKKEEVKNKLSLLPNWF